jgi:hypothetical protein
MTKKRGVFERNNSDSHLDWAHLPTSEQADSVSAPPGWTLSGVGLDELSKLGAKAGDEVRVETDGGQVRIYINNVLVCER